MISITIAQVFNPRFMRKVILFFIFFCLYFFANAATYYWVDGANANWANTSSWSATWGGTSFAGIPGNGDNVFFDNSTRNASPTIILANVITTLASLNFTSFVNNIQAISRQNPLLITTSHCATIQYRIPVSLA